MSGLPDWAEVSNGRRKHIERVVTLVESWIAAMGPAEPEADRWLRAAWLHDSLRDAPMAVLEGLAGKHGTRGLLHGPAAAVRAQRSGEHDAGVLAAVRWHTVGWADWDQAGRVLYCADFLEPGRRAVARRRARLAERFPTDPNGVLFEVAQWRLEILISTGWVVPDATQRFWNSLARPPAGA